jgi:hypothetical protein
MINELATKLSGFTTTTVQLEPNTGRQTIGPGETLEFDLPSESICNLDTFTLSFEAETVTKNGGLGHPRLPAGIEQLIEDVSVWCGGVRLDTAGSWFGKRRTLMDANMGVCGSAISHPRIQRFCDRHKLGIDAGIVGNVEQTHRYATNRLGEGFLGAGMVDTSLLPPLRVRVEFTRRPVVSFSVGSETIEQFLAIGSLNADDYEYRVLNAYACVEIVSIGDVYDALQSRIMAAKGHIPIPFKRFGCFVGGIGGNNVRFNLATRSLDRLYGVLHTPGAFGPPFLYNRVHHSLDTNFERGLDAEFYHTEHLLSTMDEPSKRCWFNLAGLQLPAFQPSVSDWYTLTQNNMPKPTWKDRVISAHLHSFGQWLTSTTMLCQRLCAPNSDLKNVSGLNTSGLSVDGVLECSDTPTGSQWLVFAESTAQLRVMPGREVKLVP